MAEHWRTDESELRNGIVKKEEKNLILSKNDVASGTMVDDADENAVRDLFLGSERLKCLPEEIGTRLKNLVSLDLRNNQLETLPPSLESLSRLETLILNDNCLSTLPEVVTGMRGLRSLEVSGNRLKSLPEDFGRLKLLKRLNLSSNLLSDLPESCAKLKRLKILDLSSNCFRNLPKCIGRGVKSLQTLDVSGNQYIDVTMAPHSRRLKRFVMKNAGRVVNFPLWVLREKSWELRTLIFDGTNFGQFDFPEYFTSLGVHTLSLVNCDVNVKVVNELLRRSPCLQCLRLGNDLPMHFRNSFRTPPLSNIKLPEIVTEICLGATGIRTVCREIGNFVNLRKIYLNDNNIYRLPNEICSLRKLEILGVENNYLRFLPEMIGDLTNLRELRAYGNIISVLPESVKNLKQILYVDLYDNEFSEFPEYFNNIESLLGVDIDCNEFDAHEFTIREGQYETMRSTLRDRYEIAEGSRITGARYESDTEEHSKSISDKASIIWDDEESMYRINENITNVEENWDLSDNSADEFDPTCEPSQSPKQKIPSFTNVLTQRFAFCPADLHTLSVRHQIMLKRQEGKIEDEIKMEDGQFDDV